MVADAFYFRGQIFMAFLRDTIAVQGTMRAVMFIREGHYMRKYRSTGMASPGGFILAVILGIILAVVVGLISFAVSNFVVYLVPMHAIFVALIVYGLAIVVMRVGKVRSLALGLILGALFGALTYGVSRAAEYGYAVYQEAQNYAGKDGDVFANLTLAQVDVDRLLQRQTGQSGVIGFVLFSAEQGMNISRFSASSSSSGGIDLDRNMTLGYFGLELLAAVIGGVLGAVTVARQPYHDEQKRWMRDSDYRHFGTVDLRVRRDFMSALDMGDYNRAGSLMMPGMSTGLMKISAVRMGQAITDDVLLRITEPAGRSMRHTYGVLSPSEFQLLLNSAQRGG